MSRRRALAGAASVGASLPLLAACGDDGDGASGSGPSSSGTSSSAPPPATTEPSTSEAPSEPASSAPAVDGVAVTGDVPVGGGVVVAGQEVVVTQPAPGEFQVFTAVCTHSGCLVADVSDTINCPCHGSTFDITTGEPTGGPAPSALDPVDFQISGNQVVLS